MEKMTRQEVLLRHDEWLLRILAKRTHRLDELQRFWLFRELMFKHWNKFDDSQGLSNKEKGAKND
jgi:hypothetical protein